MLENRVAGVEVTMTTAFGKLSSIMSDMSEIKRILVRDAGLKTTVQTNGSTATRIDADPCTPPDNTKGKQQKDATEDIVQTAPETNPRKQTTPQQVVGPHAAPVGEALLKHEDVSSHSAMKTGGGERGSLAQSPLAKTTHNNPRLKLLPVENRTAVARAPACKERGPAYGNVAGGTAAPRYRDPPGYENVSVVECTSDSDDTVPVLQPRKSSVSTYESLFPTLNPCMESYIISKAVVEQQVCRSLCFVQFACLKLG